MKIYYNPWQFAMPTSPFWGQPPVNRTMVRNRDWMYDDTNPYVPPGVGGDGRGGQTGGGGYSDGSLPGDGRGASGGGGGEVDTGGRGGAYRGGGTTSTTTVTYDDGSGRNSGNSGYVTDTTPKEQQGDNGSGKPGGTTSTTTTSGPWWANDPQAYWDKRKQVSSLSVPPAGGNPWANWANSALAGMQGGYNNATQNWGAQNQQWPVSYKDWTNGAYGQPSLWQGLQRGASNVAFGDNRRPFDHIGSGPSSGTNPWSGGNSTNLIRRPPKGGGIWR